MTTTLEDVKEMNLGRKVFMIISPFMVLCEMFFKMFTVVMILYLINLYTDLAYIGHVIIAIGGLYWVVISFLRSKEFLK